MKRIKWLLIVLGLAVLIPFPVMAGNFDGSVTLLFASQEVYECGFMSGCQEIEAADINLPSFLIIDFKKKTITATPESGNKNVTAIKRIEKMDGVLFIQGAEDGYKDVEDGVGWTVSIEQDSGKGVLTLATPGSGVVVFGVCTPR